MSHDHVDEIRHYPFTGVPFPAPRPNCCNQAVQAAVLHYKRGKVSAEGRESALKSEIDELRSRGDGEGASVERKEKETVNVGVMARLTGGAGVSTRATGVNTEEVSCDGHGGVGEVSNKRR